MDGWIHVDSHTGLGRPLDLGMCFHTIQRCVYLLVGKARGDCVEDLR